MLIDLAGILVAFLAALATSLAIVLTKRFHGGLSFDHHEGVQKFHRDATPRIGGLAVAVGGLAVWAVLDGAEARLFGLILLAGTPALIAGFWEDLTRRVSVRTRLLATFAAGAVFSLTTGYMVTRLDLPGLDYLLALPLFAFPFTFFAIGGVANAINMVDGFHGLASGTLILIALAFALVGWRVGDLGYAHIALLFAATMAGFFVVNFPLGKLFLGDGGAYFAGYLIAVLAVMLPARNPEVSPWVSLLVLGYPVTETLVSIARRMLDREGHPGAPDSAHLHHLVYARLPALGQGALANPALRNPLTGLIMLLMPGLTVLFAWACSLSAVNAVGYLLATVVIYLAVYLALHFSGQAAAPSGHETKS